MRYMRKYTNCNNAREGTEKGYAYIETEEGTNSYLYFDFHNRKYLGKKGYSEKLSVEDYEKFKERLHFFLQDKQKRVDNPVMEFIDLPRVKLVTRSKKIKVGEKLEIRAELTRKDCSPISDVEAYFAGSDSEIAKLRQKYSQKTDCDGVIYGEMEGTGTGKVYVMVMARAEGEEAVYEKLEIGVHQKE
jgi:hypothetical protein